MCTAGVGLRGRSVILSATVDGLVFWVLDCGFLISTMGSVNAGQSNVRTATHKKHSHGKGLTLSLVGRGDR